MRQNTRLLLYFAIISLGFVQSSRAGLLGFCRSTIKGIYQETLADPDTPWFTRLYMKWFPVKVQASPQPFPFLGTCEFEMITINLKHAALVSPNILRSLLTHEFMHYKHMHQLKTLFALLPVVTLLSVASEGVYYYLNLLYEKYRSDEKEKKTLFKNLCDSFLKCTVYGAPLAVYLSGFILFMYLKHHWAEFQADSSAACYTGDFEASMRLRLYGISRTKEPREESMGTVEGWLLNITYPSGEACVHNLACTAEQYRLEQLQLEYPEADEAVLREEARTWAQNILTQARIT